MAAWSTSDAVRRAADKYARQLFVSLETLSTEPTPPQTFDAFEPHVLIAEVRGDLAFSVALEDYTNTAREPQAVTLRATQVYRREDGAWRLVHRHAEALTPVAEL